MHASRLRGRQGDGSAMVLGWVAVYTAGLPAAMRVRRREEVASDLREESLDAVRRGDAHGLWQRSRRLVEGIPADLAWRVFDAPDMAADLRLPMPWIPRTRWSSVLLAIVAIGTAGGLAVVAVPYLAGTADGAWAGWFRPGFMVACCGVLVAIPASRPVAIARGRHRHPQRGSRPRRRAAAVGLLGAGGLRGRGPPDRHPVPRPTVDELPGTRRPRDPPEFRLAVVVPPALPARRAVARRGHEQRFLHIHPVRVRSHARSSSPTPSVWAA